MKLRPYQAKALDELSAHMAAGTRRLLLVASTGAGKTVCAADMIVRAIARRRRTLFAAHRRELIKQAFCKLVRSGVDPSQIGVIMPGVGYPRTDGQQPLGGFDALSDRDLFDQFAARRPNALVTVASIQTLNRRELGSLVFQFIVIDEAHRSRAASYEKLVKRYPDAYVVGLTATPIRTDGKGLGDGDNGYQKLVVVAQYRELVAQGFLVEPTVWTVPKGQLPDLSELRKKSKAADFNLSELQNVVDQPELVGDIVQHWCDHGNNAPTFVFASGVEHSRHITQRFLDVGIPAAHLDGETPNEERDQILADLSTGVIKVVSNCDVVVEGTDVPAVKTIVLARPTKSLRVYLQMVGRGSRPHDSGKPFVILDHAGSALEHGLPQDDREWELTKTRKRKGTAAAPSKACEQCWAVVAPACRVCPECGFEFEFNVAKRELREVKGELRRIGRPTTRTELVELYELLVEEWRGDNAKRELAYQPPHLPGTIHYRFKDKAGRPPPSGCALPKLTADQRAIRTRFDDLKAMAADLGHDRGWAYQQLKSELRPRRTA
jgi:DNA repair protein RadD